MAARPVTAGPIQRIEGDTTIRLNPRTRPTKPISAPIANTVRQDARSITQRLAAMTSPVGASSAGARSGNSELSAPNSSGAIVVSPPTRAMSRPILVRSTPGTSPATAPDAVSPPPARAVSGVTLVAQLSPNDQAAPANSGVRQNPRPQRTRFTFRSAPAQGRASTAAPPPANRAPATPPPAAAPPPPPPPPANRAPAPRPPATPPPATRPPATPASATPPSATPPS